MNADSKTLLSWLRLARTPGLGPVWGARLLEIFKSPEKIFSAREQDLCRVEGLRKDVVRSLHDREALDQAEADLEACEQAGIEILARDAPGYPAPLTLIPDPPLVLFMRGSLNESDHDAVAVVGCRNPDAYGESMAVSIGAGLARSGITVVSGMARGVDGIAQDAARKADGRVIAVLGTGVDVIYPPEHDKLYVRIIENGAVLSEYPPGTQASPGNFPRRNRLISGLCRGVVMVQAMSERSGALITARHAFEQGREVFAVPGNAGSRTGRAANALIKQGAHLVEGAEDIVLEIKPLGTLPLMSPGDEHEKLPERKASLPDRQAKIYALVPSPAEGTVDIDHLARQADMPAHEVLAVLLERPLAGLVKALPGKRYVLMTGV